MTYDLDSFSRSKVTDHIPVGSIYLQQIVYDLKIFFSRTTEPEELKFA
jgi:hypothetical protein